MQNPLRRPKGNPPPQRNRDVERNNNDDGGYLGKDVRGHLVAMSGEFVGTFMFLYFAFAATQIARTLPALRGALLFPAQMLGGMVAAALVRCMFPGKPAFTTTLTNGTSIAQGVFIEMFLTAELVFTVLMLAAEKSKATFIAPVGIGLALFVAELAGVYFTGGSLNPTRSFGPCVATAEFPGYHWIYWVGPFLGALISGGYYRFVKFNNYEEANPGQDDSHNPQDNPQGKAE
ncbi:MAG: hypothetical protein ASARMPREDX12_008042 [Alectoria sarmentosa]|nr:MAG: hypothetical protein ASARMPRED_007284 [Alectoria sarmentosa]CAD6594069.1 MAG: hypothetical protein ASARMPREDX12_008042 [Alectoria sarmentosa]